MEFESSSFENVEINTVVPANATNAELLPFQSNNSLVYKVRINDKWLLLKRIRHEFREHPSYVNALEKEFNIGFNLDHPHIVKYLNKGTDQNGLYLLAEYVNGETLRSLLQKNPRGIKDRALIEKIFRQLLDALNYLHKQQIFHLDLKPENIIITFKGNNVKLIDFGLSGSDTYIALSTGTRKYSSPEQIEHPEKSDARSDLYSFGLIALEISTGSIETTGIKKLPKQYRQIISKCIESIQSDRINSVDEVFSALDKKNALKTWHLLVLLVIGLFAISSYLFFHFNKHIETSPQKNNITATNINTDKNVLQITDVMSNSKNQLDSLKTAQSKLINTSLARKDSIVCCQLGDNLYRTFIKQVAEFDKNPSNRSRKLEIIDIKEKCIKETVLQLQKVMNKYELGSFVQVKLSDLYAKHSNYSESRIDSVIFKK
ncbi:MAG: serine/threonine-protein kinase [Bacteroidota bacterium]